MKVASKLPNIDSILEGNEQTQCEEIDVLYALSSGLVSHYLKNPSDEKLENLLTYSLEMKSEFAVMVVQDLQRSGINMQHISAFEEWVRKFSYLLA